jgi:uncharacterized protein (TIGR02145 family)
MARIKFNTEADQFNGSWYGNTFYSGSKVSTIRNISTGKRTMSPAQALMSGYLIGADRHWKMLTDIERAQWNLFAVTFPQISNRSPLVFLSGYELFTKRNQHYQIFATHEPRFMHSPAFAEYAIDIPAVTIYSGEGKLEIELTFTRSASDLDCFFTLSAPIHPARYFRPNGPRLIMVCKNVTQTINITDIYLSIFGRLPDPFQVINFKMFQAGEDNGQYFFPDQENIIISEPLPPVIPIKLGFLYNWPTTSNPRKLSSSDAFILPSYYEFLAVWTFLGGQAVAGGKCKDTGLTFWNSPNTGATNIAKFNGRGSGYRLSLGGEFDQKGIVSNFWSSTLSFTSNYGIASLGTTVASFSWGGNNYKSGNPIRLVRLITPLSNGQEGVYVGNDGRIYKTICINNNEWLAENLAETLYRDLTDIPYITANDVWSADTIGGRCAFANDPANV